MTPDQIVELYPLTWRRELLKLDVKLAAIYRFYHCIAYDLLPIEAKKCALVEGGQ